MSSPSQPRRPQSPLMQAALWMLVALGVGTLLYRGVFRGIHPDFSRDGALIMSCVYGWTEGLNPYDAPGLDAVWRSAGGSEQFLPSVRTAHDNLYPPSTFAVLSPLALLSWDQARTAWALLSMLMLGAALWSLRNLANIRLTSPAGMLFTAGACLAAPSITALAHGQTPLLVFGAITLAHAMRLRGRTVLAGVLLGIATAIKPQIGMVFLAYELFRMRWTISLTGLIFAAAAAGIGIARLELAGIDWLTSLRANLIDFRAPGTPSDPTLTGIARAHMTNLHVPLHAFIESRAVVTALVWGIVSSVSLAFFLIWLRRRESKPEMLTLSMASCLLLLIVYHRSYDAAVLMIPVAWVISELHQHGWSRRKTPHLITLACASVFILPGGAALALLEARGTIPASISETTLYHFAIDGHQPIALFVMACALTCALWLQAPAPAAWRARETTTHESSV